MNTTLPRPVSPLTGEISRHWHRDSRPPLLPEINGPNDGENWKAARPTPGTKGDRRRILLVDDDPTIREVFKLLLEKGGFEVVTAKDGVTGLMAFAANPNFAAVITDLRMPRADGRNLITALRAQAPHGTLAIICITGVLEGDQEAEAFKRQMGIDTVLRKPFTHAALLASLERELAPAC
jgi:CheY-like chemotaxis protein